MWRKDKLKRAGAGPAGSLLSLSGLGRQQGSLGEHSSKWPPNGLAVWATSGSRAGTPRSGTAAGSVSCRSTRDEEVHELLSSHEQMLNVLQEKVVALEDTMDRLQADVVPALKLVGAIRQAASRQQDAGEPGHDAPQLKDQDAAAAAAAQAGSAAGSTAAATNHSSAAGTQGALQPGGGGGGELLGWQHLELDPAVTRALGDLAHWGACRTQGGGRDQAGGGSECGSVRSFCTSISCGSTQVSGPAVMNDLRPAAKAPSRATQPYQQHQQQHAASLALGWGSAGGCTPGLLEAATAGGPGGCNSWPLELGLHEEASPEEIQGMIELISRPAADAAGSIEAAEQHQQLELQRQTLSCLALHAERDEEVRQQLCTPQVLQTVTAMLQGPDLGCCQAAAHLAWFISRSDGLRPQLLQQAALLPALLALLSMPDAASARAAAFALNNLAYNPAARLAMVEAGAVAGLVDMLSGCDALGQEAAAAALMMLASEESNIRATIVAHNGVQALVAVLRFGGPAAQEASASALENLSLDSACEVALAAEGAVEGLLQVLQDGTTGAQAAAVGALRNLAVNEELEGHLLAAGMVQVLVQVVGRQGEDVGVRTAALEGLRNLAATSTKAGDTLVQAGGAAALVDAARSLPAATARSAALGGLLVLSMDESHRRAITAAGAAGVLVHAALSGSLLAKEYAARGLANLATSELARIELLKEGAATVLAALLKAQIAGLAGQGGAAAAGAGAVAAGATAGCCLAAARALQNLAKCRGGAKQLLDAGCVPALSAALVLPGLIATAAVSALCSLCRTSRALTELAACDGCSRLVSAVAQPKHLTARGQRQGLRLLRRLVKGPSSCRAAVQERVAALGIVLG